MKKIWWVLIIILGALFPLIFMIVIPVVILNKSWWWLVGTLIGEFGIGLILVIIIVIVKMGKRDPPKIKLNIDSAKAKAIHEMKYDEDNPDNFKISESRLVRIGEKGLDKTPILHLKGIGTENNDQRHIIINLNNPKQEMTRLIDPTQEQVDEAIRLIAEHPPEEEIKEETTRGIDPKTGLSITTTRIRRPSTMERKIEEEKKEAEETGAL